MEPAQHGSLGRNEFEGCVWSTMESEWPCSSMYWFVTRFEIKIRMERQIEVILKNQFCRVYKWHKISVLKGECDWVLKKMEHQRSPFVRPGNENGICLNQIVKMKATYVYPRSRIRLYPTQYVPKFHTETGFMEMWSQGIDVETNDRNAIHPLWM